MFEFITRIGGEESTYKVIVETDEYERYAEIQDLLRRIIDDVPKRTVIECENCGYYNYRRAWCSRREVIMDRHSYCSDAIERDVNINDNR